MFFVGQKVVCVDDSNQVPELQKGQTYIIERGCFVGMAGKTYVHIVGVYDERKRLGKDAGLYAHRFRPLVEKKTDIAVFTALLTPSGTKVDA